MGSCKSSLSTIQRQQFVVSRCKARNKCIKQLVQARRALSLAHSFYFRSLRSTGAALLNFAATTDTWTTTTSSTVAPPPEPSAASTWDFWDSLGDATTLLKQGNEFEKIIKKLDEYFVKAAADSGQFISRVLELPSLRNLPNSNIFLLGSSGKVFNYGKNSSNSPILSTRKVSSELGFEIEDEGNSHSCTLERLYAWENKLLFEVKNAEKLKMEHKKRLVQFRSMEVKGPDYIAKAEKMKKKVEKLKSQMEVSSHTVNTICAEITMLTESQLYPQLLHLSKGFMCMWRNMYECHQFQIHIVDQLKLLLNSDKPEPASEIHRESTLRLKTELRKWHRSFCDLVRAHRDYIRTLTAWLRLSLFESNLTTVKTFAVYSLCENWQSAVDSLPDKIASEGIKNLLNLIHTVAVQQAEEMKQSQKVAEVEKLKGKTEEYKMKYDKVVRVTQEMTLNAMEIGLSRVFEAIAEFSKVCMHSLRLCINRLQQPKVVWKIKSKVCRG